MPDSPETEPDEFDPVQEYVAEFGEPPPELIEVPTNHLSPMGQADQVGEFARGMGGDVARSITRAAIMIGIGLLFVMLVFGR
ncbi:MAG: hypothetical protein AAFP84_08265 [Actinomycetota bacterium]